MHKRPSSAEVKHTRSLYSGRNERQNQSNTLSRQFPGGGEGSTKVPGRPAGEVSDIRGAAGGNWYSDGGPEYRELREVYHILG